MDTSRRNLLMTAGVAGLAASTPAAAAEPDAAPWLQAVLERYFAFGGKASGGPGDEACGAWLEERLTQVGFTCARQSFDAPFFEAGQTSLSSGAASAPVIPQALVVATGPGGLTAPLLLADRQPSLSGAIAVIVLPYKRWAGLADPAVARPLTDAFAKGAAAAVLVTTGPTGEAIALNVTTYRPGIGKPVAILAPKNSAPFIAAAVEGRTGTLTVQGRGGHRAAFNLIARLDRKAEKTLIVSTPRSGWFGCAAERGSGLAVWLWLAHQLAQSKAAINLEFVSTSGHEYEYLGGEHYLAEAAPAPAKTRLWTHIGASAAARDWHELGPHLLPLPSADSQRVLTATPDLIAGVRREFAGITGLEATYIADKAMAGGELINVLSAGYPSAIGLYGGHRFFHTQRDDMSCVSGELVKPVALAFQRSIHASING